MGLEYSMNDMVTENEILRLFRERTTAELKLALDEVKWWNDCVARGSVKSEHAKAYIEAAKRIINTKRHVLGFPEFPC
jgi:hypothetical protein